MVKAPDCGSGMRGFESPRLPHFLLLSKHIQPFGLYQGSRFSRLPLSVPPFGAAGCKSFKMKSQGQEPENQLVGKIMSDRELLLPWVLRGCQTLTVLTFIYLPWIGDGNAYHQGCWTRHAWLWQPVSGDGPIRINLPMIGCELMAIWLAYWFIRGAFPKAEVKNGQAATALEPENQDQAAANSHPPETPPRRVPKEPNSHDNPSG